MVVCVKDEGSTEHRSLGEHACTGLEGNEQANESENGGTHCVLLSNTLLFSVLIHSEACC